MDWKIIIAEIQEYGHLTQPQIAEKCGCSQATISELARGETKQPRYPVGAALKELWEQVKLPHAAPAYPTKPLAEDPDSMQPVLVLGKGHAEKAA